MLRVKLFWLSFAFLALALYGNATCSAAVLSDSSGEYDEVIFPAPEQPKEGELAMAAEWRIWIPGNVKTLRGLIVHQHGCGTGSCDSGRTAVHDLQWQALARKYDCALIAVSYRQEDRPCQLWCDPRNGSANSFLKAIDYFARNDNHPELNVVPWALWGHSGGGHWCGSMLQLYPKRVMAAWLRSGHPDCVTMTFDELPMTDDVRNIPIMLNLGARETDLDYVYDNGWRYFQKIRSKGAKIGILIDPNTHHETGNSRYPAIRFLDLCMEQRIPALAGSDELRPMQTGTVLSGDELHDEKHLEFVQDGIWLPADHYIDVCKKYALDGTFDDSTPPPAPSKVILDDSGTLTWESVADLESGLQTFVIHCDGKEFAILPTRNSVNGRPLFQGMSYSDTPVEPLVTMTWKLSPFDPNERHVWSIAAINTGGLVSDFVEASLPIVKSDWNVRDHIPLNQFTIQAHRGFGNEGPEGSDASFRRAGNSD